MLNLLLEQKKDHSSRNDILWEIPDFALKTNIGQQRSDRWRHYKHHGPSKESHGGKERTGRCAPLGKPEVHKTAEVCGKEYCVQREIGTIAGSLLEGQQED